MHRLIVIILMSIPMFLKCQELDSQIKFENDLSWEQIKQKAKKENKHIFVDYYASWCVPCKQMDKIVYTSKDVASIVNNEFVSVKVQADTAKGDNDQIKKWYSVAHSFRDQYKVGTFPTFLFFSPEGKMVHRESGFKMPNDFIKVINDAIEPNKQLYTQLEQYKQNIKNYQAMPALARNVYSILNDRELALQIANDYNKNYLNKLNRHQLLEKDNIEFISWYPKVLRSGDTYLDIFLKDANKVDSIMGQPNFSSKMVDFVISEEEIFPKIYEQGNGKPRRVNPDWKSLLASVERKYGKERAERNVLDAQIGWYLAKRDWNNAIKFNVIKIEKEGIDTTFFGRFGINNFCYELIFKHSSDTSVIKKAISWMKVIVNHDPNAAPAIDTYANLLYKFGRVDEAINWQTKAATISPEDREITDHLLKMKKNEPTWVILTDNF